MFCKCRDRIRELEIKLEQKIRASKWDAIDIMLESLGICRGCKEKRSDLWGRLCRDCAIKDLDGRRKP